MDMFQKLCKTIVLLILCICTQITHIKTKRTNKKEEIHLNERKSEERQLISWAFSPSHLTFLAKEESKIYKLVVEYKKLSVMHQGSQLLNINKYIQDYEDSANTGNQNNENHELRRAKSISAHPLKTYRMIRRFVYDLKDITRNISREFGKPLLEKLESMKKFFELPQRKDLNDVMSIILRLQNVYELSAKDLMNGLIAGKNTTVGLTLAQAFEIGKYAISQKLYSEGFDWMQNLITKLKIHPGPLQENKFDQVFTSMKKLIEDHNNLQDSINSHNYYTLSRSRFTTKINLSSKIRLETLRSFERRQNGDDYLEKFALMDICSGLYLKSMAERPDIFCHLQTFGNPQWTINPLKIEIHSWDPYVYQIYDAIGESVMNYVQYLTMTKLDKEKFVKKKFKYAIKSGLPSFHALLSDRLYKPLLDLEKKTGHMTDLKVENVRSDGKHVGMEASERTRVVVYGFGGHFVQHLDALEDCRKVSSVGDRMATILFYLNDVEKGGYTVFSDLGLAVVPIKGSALVWYGLLRNGDVDRRTRHGGCPVILGEKWVANKWVRYNANFLKRPCSLNPEE